MIDIEKPSKLTDEVRKKLEEAFAIGADITSACFYAGISRQSYYNWIENDEELKEKFDSLREKPVLKAYQTVASNLDNIDVAKWYLERKRKNEFSTRVETVDLDEEKLNETVEAINNLIKDDTNESTQIDADIVQSGKQTTDNSPEISPVV